MEKLDLIEITRKRLREEIDKRFQAKHYRTISTDELAEIELYVQGGKIELSILDWDGAGACCIRYVLIKNRDEEESILTEIYKICIILKDLHVITRKYPQIDYYEAKGTGDINIELIYIIETFEIESIMYVLEAFNRIDLSQMRLDKQFIREHYGELFDLLSRKGNESREKFRRIAESEFRKEFNCLNVSEYKPVVSNIFSKQDCVYSNYNQKIYVGFTQEGIEHYIHKYQLDLHEFSDYYEGVQYNIMTVPGTACVWEKRLWLEAFNWLYILEMHYGDVPNYTAYDKGRIIIRVVEFWVCIMTEADRLKEKILYEKQQLQDMQKKYLNHTDDKFFAPNYDLYQLSPEEFENMCCDLLHAEGYKNVYKRGKLNTADGGIDMEAVEVVRGINTREEKKWIFQCKRAIKIDRKELNEIPFLLKEFKADRYGLFYAGILNPSVIDRCKTFDPGVVWVFDENFIKQKLKEYRSVADKYFPLYRI